MGELYWMALLRDVKFLDYGSVFFQAADGIRAADVTGVQTCALPIFAGSRGPVTETPSPHAALSLTGRCRTRVSAARPAGRSRPCGPARPRPPEFEPAARAPGGPSVVVHGRLLRGRGGAGAIDGDVELAPMAPLPHHRRPAVRADDPMRPTSVFGGCGVVAGHGTPGGVVSMSKQPDDVDTEYV